MAANRRRLVHRLQAEDPLDLSASGDKYALGRIGLARLGRPDRLTLRSLGCTGTIELRDIVILPPAREGKTGKVGGLLRLLVVRLRSLAVSPSLITHSTGSMVAVPLFARLLI